jgi:hypothetical protein
MEPAMPDLLLKDIDAALHARLSQWAGEQGRPLPLLARDILAAAERARDAYNSIEDRTVRDIRRHRDGGCGLCDELEPLFAPGFASAKLSRQELIEEARRIRAMSPYSDIDSTDLIREDRDNDEPYR